MNQYELLKSARYELNKYTKEHPNEGNTESNVQHLPFKIERLIDRIISRRNRSIDEVTPSLYVFNLNDILNMVNVRLSHFEKHKSLFDSSINDLREQFSLTENDIGTLNKLVFNYLDEVPATDLLTEAALEIMEKNIKFDNNLNPSSLSINLIEKALELSKIDNSEAPPKRYAFLLAEIYCKARKEFKDKVEYNPEKAMHYLKEAQELGSKTAKSLLSDEFFTSALNQKNRPGAFSSNTSSLNKKSVEQLFCFSLFAKNEKSNPVDICEIDSNLSNNQ